MPIGTHEFDELRSYIEDVCGIALGAEKSYLVEARLAPLLSQAECKDYASFSRVLRQDRVGIWRDRMIDAMTTNETLWFRDIRPWRAIEEKIIPDFIGELQSGRRREVRIWSAACSTGQEPYSLAIKIDRICQAKGVDPSSFKIKASDVSQEALDKAKAASYDSLEMSRGMNDYIKGLYFDELSSVEYRVKDMIRNRVSFERFNFQDSFVRMGKFDLVLCRNVLIYFSEDFKRLLYAQFEGALQSNGIFLLGGSESILNYQGRFERESYKDAMFYRKVF